MFNLPYVIWMLRSFFTGVPVEIEERALVDGKSRFGTLWRVTLPLALPSIIATAVFAFIFSWTEFLFAVTFTRTQTVALPVTIAGYYGAGSDLGTSRRIGDRRHSALFVLGLLVQRDFVRGLTLGAVRG